VAQEGQRRSIFLRYLGEVATAVAQINGQDAGKLYEQLLAVAKKKTAEADVKLDDRGRPIREEEDLELGDNCIIVPQVIPGQADGNAMAEPKPAAKGKGKAKGRQATIATVDDDAAESPAAAPKRPAAEKPAARKRGAAKKPAARRRR